MWRSGGHATTLQNLHDKPIAVARGLVSWWRAPWSSFFWIEKTEGRIRENAIEPTRTSLYYEETKLMERIVKPNHHEEIMWQQRSQIRWLSVGDKNTRFFHLRASQLRKKKNRITRLRKLDGQSMKDSHELRNLATTFYRDIYTSIGVGNMAAVLDIVSPKVTEIMNSKLIAPIDER